MYHNRCIMSSFFFPVISASVSEKHGEEKAACRPITRSAAQTCRDKKTRQFYSGVRRRRGRPKAKVAAARKLLVNYYVMLREEIGYEEFTRRGEVGLCEGSGELGTGAP